MSGDSDERHGDELAGLARSVRRLIEATVLIQAPAEALRAATVAMDALADRLQAHAPDPPPPRYPSWDGGDIADVFPYDPVIGRYNPLAPPIRIEIKDEHTVGNVRFGKPYEGPPGCVHGAAIAAAFDQMFNVANLVKGTPGPTARLELSFKRPTPLLQDVRFECWRERVEDRKVHAAGRLVAGDLVTVEARGLFILIPLERVTKMLGPR